MYKALGADFKEVIVEGNPPRTSSDVEKYLEDWLSYLDAHWGRKKSLVAYSVKVKDMVNVKMIEETCGRYVNFTFSELKLVADLLAD